MKPSRDISALIAIMAALRTPKTGCPWDIEQDFASVAPYTLEEAYEVADAVERNDMVDLREELGDLLLQVVFHAQMAEEQQLFDFGSVVEAITTKLIRRHPHVFGNTRDLTPEQVKELWDSIKKEEKQERAEARRKAGQPEQRQRYLNDIPMQFPALVRADKLTSKAAKVGFDWPTTREVLDKIEEELGEVKEALQAGNKDSIEDEIGDLLFAVANLARHAKIDPETALRRTNAKFERRFAAIEDALVDEGRNISQSNLEEMDRIWNAVKNREKTGN
jgi:MazG family protein